MKLSSVFIEPARRPVSAQSLQISRRASNKARALQLNHPTTSVSIDADAPNPRVTAHARSWMHRLRRRFEPRINSESARADPLAVHHHAVASSPAQPLTEMARHCPARVTSVTDLSPGDPVAERLRVLGFVDDEPVELLTRGPFGGDPILVRVGGTRFALRQSEARRILVRPV